MKIPSAAACWSPRIDEHVLGQFDIRAQLSEQLKWLDSRVESQAGIVLELQDYFRRRADVELEYSRQLDKLARQLLVRHRSEKPRRDQWHLFSSYQCWQQLVSTTRKQSTDHAKVAEIYQQQLTSKLQHASEDFARVYRTCRAIGCDEHEELLKVLHELHATMKTYHSYRAMEQQAAAKLTVVETNLLKLEQALPKEKIAKSRRYRLLSKERQKRWDKNEEARLKALKARNDYVLCIEAANATVHKYFVDDVSDLIDAIDFGFHTSLSRSLLMYNSTLDCLQRSLKSSQDAMQKCLENLDSRADKQKFLETNHSAFMAPNKFSFQPHKGDTAASVAAAAAACAMTTSTATTTTVSSSSSSWSATSSSSPSSAAIAAGTTNMALTGASKAASCSSGNKGTSVMDKVGVCVEDAILEDIEQRFNQLQRRLADLKIENEEVWKTLETAERTLLEMIESRDYNVAPHFDVDADQPQVSILNSAVPSSAAGGGIAGGGGGHYPAIDFNGGRFPFGCTGGPSGGLHSSSGASVTGGVSGNAPYANTGVNGTAGGNLIAWPPETAALKVRADKHETEDFYLDKFREYTTQCSVISRLQARYDSLEAALLSSPSSSKYSSGLNKDTVHRACTGAHALLDRGLANSSLHSCRGSASCPPRRPRRKRIGRQAVTGQPRLFGGSLEEYAEATGQEVPLVVRSCIRVINLFGLHHQGVFRVSGSQLEINNFREAFERGEDPLAEVSDASDINSVAGVLKLYLRELREPLFPIFYFDQLMEISQLASKNPHDFVARAKDVVQNLPRPHFAVLRYLFAFLNHLSELSDENMMCPWNLAICFGPTLLPIPEDKNPVQVQPLVNELVKGLIVHQEEIFPILQAEYAGGTMLYEKYISPSTIGPPAVEELDSFDVSPSDVSAHNISALLIDDDMSTATTITEAGSAAVSGVTSVPNTLCTQATAVTKAAGVIPTDTTTSSSSSNSGRYSGDNSEFSASVTDGVVGTHIGREHHILGESRRRRSSAPAAGNASRVGSRHGHLSSECDGIAVDGVASSSQSVDGDLTSDDTEISLNLFGREGSLEAVAQYDFEARHDGELSFRRGEVVRLTHQLSADWWRGSLRGRYGLVPDKYIMLNIRDDIQQSHETMQISQGTPKSTAAMSMIPLVEEPSTLNHDTDSSVPATNVDTFGEPFCQQQQQVVQQSATRQLPSAHTSVSLPTTPLFSHLGNRENIKDDEHLVTGYEHGSILVTKKHPDGQELFSFSQQQRSLKKGYNDHCSLASHIHQRCLQPARSLQQSEQLMEDTVLHPGAAESEALNGVSQHNDSNQHQQHFVRRRSLSPAELGRCRASARSRTRSPPPPPSLALSSTTTGRRRLPLRATLSVDDGAITQLAWQKSGRGAYNTAMQTSPLETRISAVGVHVAHQQSQQGQQQPHQQMQLTQVQKQSLQQTMHEEYDQAVGIVDTSGWPASTPLSQKTLTPAHFDEVSAVSGSSVESTDATDERDLVRYQQSGTSLYPSSPNTQPHVREQQIGAASAASSNSQSTPEICRTSFFTEESQTYGDLTNREHVNEDRLLGRLETAEVATEFDVTDTANCCTHQSAEEQSCISPLRSQQLQMRQNLLQVLPTDYIDAVNEAVNLHMPQESTIVANFVADETRVVANLASTLAGDTQKSATEFARKSATTTRKPPVLVAADSGSLVRNAISTIEPIGDQLKPAQASLALISGDESTFSSQPSIEPTQAVEKTQNMNNDRNCAETGLAVVRSIKKDAPDLVQDLPPTTSGGSSSGGEDEESLSVNGHQTPIAAATAYYSRSIGLCNLAKEVPPTNTGPEGSIKAHCADVKRLKAADLVVNNIAARCSEAASEVATPQSKPGISRETVSVTMSGASQSGSADLPTQSLSAAERFALVDQCTIRKGSPRPIPRNQDRCLSSSSGSNAASFNQSNSFSKQGQQRRQQPAELLETQERQSQSQLHSNLLRSSPTRAENHCGCRSGAEKAASNPLVEDQSYTGHELVNSCAGQHANSFSSAAHDATSRRHARRKSCGSVSLALSSLQQQREGGELPLTAAASAASAAAVMGCRTEDVSSSVNATVACSGAAVGQEKTNSRSTVVASSTSLSVQKLKRMFSELDHNSPQSASIDRAQPPASPRPTLKSKSATAFRHGQRPNEHDPAGHDGTTRVQQQQQQPSELNRDHTQRQPEDQQSALLTVRRQQLHTQRQRPPQPLQRQQPVSVRRYSERTAQPSGSGENSQSAASLPVREYKQTSC